MRDALRADLDRPVVITGAATRVGVHGMGGIGKSVLANALVRDRKVREAFPDGIVWVRVGVSPKLVELQRRVHRDLGCDGAFLTEHEGKQKLKETLANQSVLLILDDVWRRSDADAFDVLGPRCRAMITTRDSGLLISLGGTHHVVELLTDEEALRLLSQAVGVEQHALPTEAVEIVAECGRLPLAVALCGGMLRRGLGWRAVLEQLQQARIDRIADRHAVEPQHQNVWNCIHVSVEYLSSARTPNAKHRFLELAVFPPDEGTPEAAVATLWQHTGALDAFDTQELLVTLTERSLLQLSSTPGSSSKAAGRRVGLHDLVYDYMRRALGDLQPLHGQLLSAYQAKCPDGWPSGPNDGYFFTHLRDHLITAGRGVELADLLHDLRWLEAKHAAGLVFDLARDFPSALKAITKSHSKRCTLKLLDEALRRDINFLSRHAQDYPQGVLQCLWNLCYWYDSPAAAIHYDQPKPNRSGAARPWAQPAPKLCELVESWRVAKQKSNPGFLWVRSLRPPAKHLGTGLRAVLGGHEAAVEMVAVAPNGRWIVSASKDRTVRIWDGDSGVEVHCLRGHKGDVHCVAWSPDSTRILSGSSDKTVRLWDATNGTELVCLREPRDHVYGVTFSPDGSRLIAGCEDRTVRVWDTVTGAEKLCLAGHEGGVLSVAVSPDGKRITSGAKDKTVRQWDATTGVELACLRPHKGSVRSIAYSPDGTRFATGSEDNTVRIWDSDSGVEQLSLCPLGSIFPGQRPVFAVAFAPDGGQLATANYTEKAVRIWDTRTGTELMKLYGHDHLVPTVAYAPNGQWLVSGSWDQTVRIWELQEIAPLRTLRGHNDRVMSVAYSPDGSRIISMGRGLPGVNPDFQSTVRLWDAASGVELRCLLHTNGIENWIDSVAYSPDGRRILAVLKKQTLVLDAETGACLETSPETNMIATITKGESNPPWRATSGDLETVIESVETGAAVAYFPAPLNVLATHPRGLSWAGASGDHLYILTLGYRETPKPPVRLHLWAGVLQEKVSHPQRLILWKKGRFDEGFQYWHRIMAILPLKIHDFDDICAMPAISYVYKQDCRRFFARVFRRRSRRDDSITLYLPTGELVDRTDRPLKKVLIAWSSDENSPLSPEQLAKQWPQHEGIERLGDNLFVVAGVAEP